MNKEIIVCKRCVMDSTDEKIQFDENGYCNYCNYALETMNKRWLNDLSGKAELNKIVDKMKSENSNKKYDCIIGLSGGLDSSYLAYYMKKEYNLRMLAVHVDTGWNTEVSSSNIKKICDKMNIDLVVETLDPVEFMDLQRAYFLSGVPSQDNPQDHIFQGVLFNYARKNDIKYFLSGANFSTESILQKGNSYIALDKVNLEDIHKKYGRVPLRKLPRITLFDRYIKFRFIHKVIMVKPLNFIDYRLKTALKELETEVGFEYYGGKHYESVFTKFFQEYYLPIRYNFDKRKSHLSSLIITNQITRDDAIEKLKSSPYDEVKIKETIKYILQKMDMSEDEFEKSMNMRLVSNYEFKTSNWLKLYKIAVRFRRILGE